MPRDAKTALTAKLSRAALEEPGTLLLDTNRPLPGHRHSYLFTSPREIIRTRCLDEVGGVLDAVSERSRRFWVAGYLCYEAAFAFEQRLRRMEGVRRSYPFDLAWFGVYDTPRVLDRRLHINGSTTMPGTPRLRKSIDRERFTDTMARIETYIARGDTYQINFTYDNLFYSNLSAPDLYRTLRARQPVPFSACINTGSREIVSLSPELFFESVGRRIVTRPMKGTAGRGRYPGEDERIARELAADPKNRAENVMIVDLLRNDLGRICEVGSVEVAGLFQVETHPTLHQMTSTVRGTLRQSTTIADIFRALFPCGSVTGAPKIRSMEIIHELESGVRGVYCGAIGYAAPSGRMVFSVPIRTLHRAAGRSTWTCRVGSGIVGDSDPDAEWVECATKCLFLTRALPEVELLESLLWDGKRLRWLAGHTARMRSSAAFLDFPFVRKAYAAVLAEIRASLGRTGSAKVRLLLDKQGRFNWTSAPTGIEGSTRVVLSDKPVDSSNTLLFHKTTHRPWYRDAMQRITGGDLFDVLHVNERGELTEGARSNLFVKLDSELVTPPVACGLLDGVLRGSLVRSGRCVERVLYPSDLRRAEALYCGNSVRGLVKVSLR